MSPAVPPPQTDSHDLTHQKLLEAAGEVFAERGYEATTVRDICARAGANVAAVNYHFGDKTGLYVAVLRQSICAAQQKKEAALAAAAGSPEERLRSFILGMLRRMTSGEQPSWAFRLMAHEMVRPTPAFRQVIDEIIRPNYEFLRVTLSELLGLPPDHETTRMCAHSIIGQVIHYLHARPVITVLWPDLRMTPGQIEKLADHIAAFSLCSVKEFAKRRTT